MTSLAAGRVGDIIGRKGTLFIGALVFTLGGGGTDIYNRIRSNGSGSDCQWIWRRSSIVRYNLSTGRVPIADVFAALSCLSIRVKYHRQIMYDVYPAHIHCWLNSCREEPWLA